MDTYLQTQALVEQELGLSTVRVAVDSDAATNGPPMSVPIIGFFSLGPTTINVDPRLLKSLGLPPVEYSRVGGYLLGMLGVRKASQGQGIGPALVARALEFAKAAQAEFGGAFLSVDAEAEKLVSFYEKLGFTRLSGTRKLVRRL